MLCGEKPMKVYAVVCTYGGCDICRAGAHIIGVYTSYDKACKVEKAHSVGENSHLHYFDVDTVALDLDYP